MKNIEKYQSLLETGEVDALLLTSVYNRLYAAQYLSLIHIATMKGPFSTVSGTMVGTGWP